MTNDLVKRDVGEIAPADLFSGKTGLEGIDQDCLVVPFLKIAQSSSKQTKKEFPELYIPGLDTGSFFSASLRKIYGPSMRFVILKFYRNFTVYSNETPDADFLGTITPSEFRANVEHAPGSRKPDGKSYIIDANGHRYVDCRNFIVENFDHPEDGRMMFTMSSSNIKASKNLLSIINSVPNPKNPDSPAPLWSSVYQMTTAFDPDPRGSYYKVGLVERLGWVPIERATRYVKLFKELEEIAIEAMDEDSPAPAAPAATAGQSVVDKVFAKAPAPKAGSDEEELF